MDKQQFELTDYFKQQKKRILVQWQRKRVDVVEGRKVGIRVTLKSNIKAVWVRAGFTMEQSPGFPRPQKRKTAVHSLNYSQVRAATQIKVHVSGGS